MCMYRKMRYVSENFFTILYCFEEIAHSSILKFLWRRKAII